MDRFNKVLRTLGLILLIILALSGIGIAPPKTRELFTDKEVTIELVEGKKDGSEESKT